MRSRRAEEQSENHLVLLVNCSSSYPLFSFVLSSFYFCSIPFISLTWDGQRVMQQCAEVHFSLSPLFYSIWACSFFLSVFLFSPEMLAYTDGQPRRAQIESFPLFTFLSFILSLSLSLLLVTWEVLRWWREGDQSAKVFFLSLFT